MLAKAVIIIRVNNGEFALGERDTAEGVAVANAAVEKDRQDTQPLKPGWYVKANFDRTPLQVSN